MRRLRRLIFNTAADLSLILCAASVVFWIRGCAVSDTLTRRNTEGFFEAAIQRGYLATVWEADRSPQARTSPAGWIDWQYTKQAPEDISTTVNGMLLEMGNPPRDWHFLGVIYIGGVYPFLSLHFLAIPLWQLVLVFAFLPVVRFVIWRCRRIVTRRLCAGLCPHCGYDLRASPDRCPECGGPVPPIRNFAT